MAAWEKAVLVKAEKPDLLVEIYTVEAGHNTSRKTEKVYLFNYCRQANRIQIELQVNDFLNFS